MGYTEIKAIYDKTRLDMFCMMTSYLLDIGFRNAKEITDEEIENAEGNGIMTKEFVQGLMKQAREIANICTPTDLIILCQAEDVFDTSFVAGKIQRSRLEVLFDNAVTSMMCDDFNGHTVEDIADYLGATEDEMEMLGYEIEED